MRIPQIVAWPAIALAILSCNTLASEPAEETQVYENRLVPIAKLGAILADHPEWVEPIREAVHYEAPPLVVDEGADLEVRAWRFSQRARHHRDSEPVGGNRHGADRGASLGHRRRAT